MATASPVWGVKVETVTVRRLVDTEQKVEVPAVTRIFLTLSVEEAQLLADIGLLIGGSVASRRGVYEDIKEALASAGIQCSYQSIEDLDDDHDNTIYFREVGK